MKHIVRQGECVTSIAARHGVAEAEIVRHPSNRDLFATRHPNVLAPGDVLHLPPRPERSAPAFSGGGATNRYRARIPTCPLVIALQDSAGRPLVGLRYELRVGALSIEGTTDDRGRVSADVPVSGTSATLRVRDAATGAGMTFAVDIGHLDPHDDPGGVRGRLENLGYVPRGSYDEAVREKALRAFQRRVGLPEHGEADAATIAALREHAGI